MSDWLGALLLVAIFAIVFKSLRLVRAAERVGDETRRSLVVIGDRRLSDDDKERALRGHAGRLLGLFLLLTLGGAAALAAPLLVLRGLAVAGWFSWDGVMAVALSWSFVAATCAAAVVVVWIRRRRAAKSADGFENRYSATDRWLHRLAFDTVPLQLTLADMEDGVFRRRIAAVETERPVFIAGLPRAGTTLLLEMVAGLDEFVTHTYRAMPFVLTPLGWSMLSRPFRKKDVARERAHGDGMTVSADSPEALEEVLWMGFWEEHYGADRIRPWGEDEGPPEFADFFHRHVRKLAAARRGGRAKLRYASKNNLNIARVRWLLAAMPDARMVIPFREPVQHAASLQRQHRNFMELHARDGFACEYMKGIGHFDFGANLRPVDFGGWVDRHADLSPDGLAFWLRYWIEAYGALAEVTDARVCRVDFEALCAEPEAGLGRVADFLEIEDRVGFLAQAGRIRAPRPHGPDMTGVGEELLAEAAAVHRRLQRSG